MLVSGSIGFLVSPDASRNLGHVGLRTDEWVGQDGGNNPQHRRGSHGNSNVGALVTTCKKLKFTWSITYHPCAKNRKPSLMLIIV